MQKLKLFLATIFGGIALLGAALPQSDKPTHSDSDKPKLTFSDDKNAADHPVPTQRMVMIGKQAVVRITAPGCNDWNVWARVTDLFSNETSSRIGENPPYGMIGRVEETSASSKPGPRLDSTRLRGARGNSRPYRERKAPSKAGEISRCKSGPGKA
jgi:hypothetical protein